MTATVISFSLQKGGVGKTTTCGLTAYLLAKRGYKVLAIDMDSQGNLTQLISDYDDLEVFYEQTIREAMIDGDVTEYIKVATDNIHYVPADDYLVLIADHKGSTSRIRFLTEAIASIKEDYDFILIDTPPNLSIQTVNALMASDYVVMLFETAKFSYNAIPRFMEAVGGAIDSGNTNLKIIGILATLSDARRTDSKELINLVREEYKDLIFDTVISRRAAIGRLSVYGISNNPEIKAATDQHEQYVEELLERVNKGQVQQTAQGTAKA